MKVTSLTSKECWYFFIFKTYVMSPRLMRRGSLDISLDTIQMSLFPILWVFHFCLIKRYRWASADNCWNPIYFPHKYPRFITTAYKMTSNTARVAVIGLGEISRRPMYTMALNWLPRRVWNCDGEEYAWSRLWGSGIRPKWIYWGSLDGYNWSGQDFGAAKWVLFEWILSVTNRHSYYLESIKAACMSHTYKSSAAIKGGSLTPGL